MKWLIILLLCIPIVYGSSLNADISISKNDIVREDITLLIDAEYDVVRFASQYMPLSVDYEGEYSLISEDDVYILEFPYDDMIEFSLYYDDLIDRSFSRRVFRTSFFPEDTDDIYISLILPTHYVLSEKQPNVIPRPDSITTDGQKIKLSWELVDGADISVFYRGQRTSTWWPVALIIVLMVFISFVALYKKKSDKKVYDTLSSEEIKIMEEIDKGEERQDKIAKNLEFSKSKMSKVVRKLEEKNMINKEPYFKTNILKKK